MEGLTFQDAFAIQQSWDYVVYFILFLQLILMALLFTGSLRDTIFIAITMLCAFADKSYLFGYIEGGAQAVTSAVHYHTTVSFWTYAIRVTMFFLPMVIVTQTKVKLAKPISIVLTLTSLIYIFARWFTQQRHSTAPPSVGFMPMMLFTFQFGMVHARHTLKTRR